MALSLLTIAEELRRLQAEGVDRVFVDNQTFSSLNQRESEAAKVKTKHAVAAHDGAEHSDLRALVEASSASVSPAQSATKDTTSTKSPALLPESPPEIILPDGDAQSRLEYLEERVLGCPVCQAHLSPHGKIVFGAGHPSADIFFCGEAPGTEEELTGEPFAGEAGHLLSKIITAMGLDRKEVYTANILNWRPQHDKPYGNRPPTVQEMRFCLPYLEAQIDIVQPKVIVALGNAAVTGLLGPDPSRKLAAVRGTWSQFKQRPLMISFHPAYLLRNGTMKTKRMLWEDMLKVMEKCDLPITDRQRGYFLPKA